MVTVRAVGNRPAATCTQELLRTTQTLTTTQTSTCGTKAEQITRSLLGYGVVAGPLYVGVSLVQALTREGFDLSRHQWSLLANGSAGWIQILNFGLTGAALVAFPLDSVGSWPEGQRPPGHRG